MSLLFQAMGFFSHGKMKMVGRPDVHYVKINITTNGFEFIGTSAWFKMSLLSKNSTGFRLDIPWSNIKNIRKSKARAMHVIIIETLDFFYTILPMDPQHTSGFGISSSNRNAIELLAAINEAKEQVDNSKSIFCTNCGEKLKLGSNFCVYCGLKIS